MAWDESMWRLFVTSNMLLNIREGTWNMNLCFDTVIQEWRLHLVTETWFFSLHSSEINYFWAKKDEALPFISSSVPGHDFTPGKWKLNRANKTPFYWGITCCQVIFLLMWRSWSWRKPCFLLPCSNLVVCPYYKLINNITYYHNDLWYV